jgi:hypothetical protein
MSNSGPAVLVAGHRDLLSHVRATAGPTRMGTKIALPADRPGGQVMLKSTITEPPRVTGTGHLTVYGQLIRWPRGPSLVVSAAISALRQAHTYGHGACSSYGQTGREGHHQDVHAAAGGAGGPAAPRGPPGAPLRHRSARGHGHGPGWGSWRRGATNATHVGCPALNGEREASARCTMTMNSKTRAFGPQPSRPARAMRRRSTDWSRRWCSVSDASTSSSTTPASL